MILLDTHVWVGWIESSDRLAPAHRELIRRTLAEGDPMADSAVSGWELGLLTTGGRISLSGDLSSWIRDSIADPALEMLPLIWELAVASTRLPGAVHRDPADRFLVATARQHRLTLVTADRRIRAYPHVESI